MKAMLRCLRLILIAVFVSSTIFAGQNACGQGFAESFDQLQPGGLIGQSGWRSVATGWQNPSVVAGIGAGGSNALSSTGDPCGAMRDLPYAYYYNNTDHGIVWSAKVWVSGADSGYSQSLAGVVTAGNGGSVVFGIERSSQTGNVPRALFGGRLGGTVGDVLVPGHWYDMQLTVDFGVSGGRATLRYRDLTIPGQPLIVDGSIVNRPMGVPLVNGNYLIVGAMVIVAAPSSAAPPHLDDVQIAAPPRGGDGSTSISLQAKLDGVPDGTANLVVQFYNAPSAGAQVGSPIFLTNVPVTSGIVSVIVPVSPTYFGGQDCTWMGVAVNGGSELSPRTLVTASPLAMAFRGPRVELAGSNGVAVHFFDQMDPDGANVGSWTLQTEAWGAGYWGLVRRNATGPLSNRGFVVTPDGRMGIGTNNPGATLDINGTTRTGVLVITGADVAEPFNVANSDTSPEPIPGMVVSIDPSNPGKLTVCSTPYDKKVAGAISGAGGLSVGVVMGKDNPDPLIKGDHPVAMSGRVYVWCDASSGAITPGDRLTTSSTPGHAMKVSDEASAGGAVIGKAMTGLKEGKGLVLVLVNLQ